MMRNPREVLDYLRILVDRYIPREDQPLAHGLLRRLYTDDLLDEDLVRLSAPHPDGIVPFQRAKETPTPVQLSPHFSLVELTRTSTGLLNVPGPSQVEAMSRLCRAVLEPWRDVVGALKINSGFRSPAVNRACGGSTTSQHVRGEATDVVPTNMSLELAWIQLVRLAMVAGLPIDQAICYVRPPGQGWIHVSHKMIGIPRREFLVQPASRPGEYLAWETFPGELVLTA